MIRLLYIFAVLFSHFAFGQVTLFEPGLIPGNQAFGLSISPNGKELVFVKSFGGRDTLQIYYSKKENGKWQMPRPAFFADLRFKQIDPAFSPDGNAILFNTLASSENSYDIYITRKTLTGWNSPEKLSDSINTVSSDFFATMSKQGNIYFTKRIKSNDIYVSYFVNNEYRKAVLLDTTINTAGNESNPYISPNEDFIIFFADYTNGFGDSDLYISFKKQNKWSYPINLGSEINSKLGEFCPGIDFDGGLFLFSRTELINGKRKDNIYTYPLKKLKIRKLKRLAKWPN